MKTLKTALWALLVCAAVGNAAAAPPKLDVPFTRYQLPNGLTVILHEDHRTPVAVVDLWFQVGSKDERAGRSGFAHLFEHLMFMGTKAVPNGQYDAIMEAAGGSNNASTSEDRTNYFEVGPANLLETFLWLEADRLSTLPDDMTKEKVDLQRDVVKNERRQSYENRPYGKVELVLPEHLYPEDNPYHHPVIGSHVDLEAASVDDVKEFFHTYYVPSNATLVLAGDFKAADARKLVTRYFGWMPKRPVPPHAAPKPTALAKSERVVIPDDVQLDQVTVAWKSTAAFQPGDAESELLAAVLASGKSSRLYKRLVYDEKIAQTVTVEQRASRYDGSFVIQATAQPGHKAEELEKSIDAALATLDSTPPTAAELDRARKQLENQVLSAVDKTFAMADMLNAYQFYLGDPGQLAKKLLARYETPTVAAVAKQAEMLDGPHVTIVVVPASAGKGGK